MRILNATCAIFTPLVVENAHIVPFIAVENKGSNSCKIHYRGLTKFTDGQTDAAAVGESRGGRGSQVAAGWNSCGGIGRKCAFYNGFAGCVPTKFRFRCAACNQAAILVRYVVFSVGVLYP